jgi:3'-phosphoadenosine 5'-phosphosulfate sulfotransferase (PAPS reductase)/FAD synthetase
VIPSECKEALREHQPSHIFALFSGGHDSLCSTHLASKLPGFSGVVHCNTGIGIEETHQWVRDVCEGFEWPLHELFPKTSYEELVLEGRTSKTTGRHIAGFPCGKQSHNSMLWHLKEEPLFRFTKPLKKHLHDRIGLVSGIRTGESKRRMGADMSVFVKRKGRHLWLNPILEWKGLDKNHYMEDEGLPRNFLVDLLERSAECMCGAMARREELADMRGWAASPTVAKKLPGLVDFVARIEALEYEAKRRGLDDHFWAMESNVSAAQLQFEEADPSSPLCVGCDLRQAA